MEQSLPIAANLLYQQASIVADVVLAEQHQTGSVPDVPADFQKKFYAFLDRITGHLMEDKDNFFGYFLFQMVKDIRFDMASPTGTNFKGTRYHLYFNPMLFLPLSPEQMESTIKHEILHVVSLHLIRAKELRQQYSKLAVNLAMDVVVNTYLDHLPPFSTTLEWVNMNYALLLKPFESLEYYVDKIQGALNLRTDKKDLPESDSDSDESIAVSYDPAKTHDLWDEGDDIDEETLRKFTEKYIDASCKGELSNYLESMIAALKDAQEDLPWHWYLKKLVGSVTSTWKKTTMRRNRRQPERLDLPGCLRSHTAKILIGLDISGSITDAEFRQAIGEVLHLVRCYNHEIIVAECDDEIRRTYRIRTMDDVRGRLDIRGGTAYSPVFTYANTQRVDLVVYFTDGKGEEKLQTPPKGYKVLWVLSGKGDKLSLKKPFGLVKRLTKLPEYDPSLDFDDVEKGGFSMNHQEGISMP
ncbi:VWA-like domain-containing protein [Megasphaera sp.]|uniref:vWA domain-containing protein n=1 Tax=Megasphaera sp. TaxID=2023260 RepID=UPI00266BE74F|nr:VWA-like domain-containing protein [uncultured Megasphaera sp.]